METAMKKHLEKILIALMLVSLPAMAADKAPAPPKGSTPVPDGAPTASDIEEPSITIRSKGSERVEEFRLRGKLYMIRVTPPKGKPYFLVDQMGRGEFTRHEGPAAPTAVPQWVIKTF
jgi:hypothetical protein